MRWSGAATIEASCLPYANFLYMHGPDITPMKIQPLAIWFLIESRMALLGVSSELGVGECITGLHCISTCGMTMVK